MAKKRQPERVGDFLDLFASMVADITDTSLIAEMFAELEYELPGALDYESYDTDAVYSDARSNNTSSALRSDLDFVEDDDAAHEFDS